MIQTVSRASTLADHSRDDIMDIMIISKLSDYIMDDLKEILGGKKIVKINKKQIETSTVRYHFFTPQDIGTGASRGYRFDYIYIRKDISIEKYGMIKELQPCIMHKENYKDRLRFL